ncbi:MAG: stage III sporulation protein AG [Muricoprocola sp.]
MKHETWLTDLRKKITSIKKEQWILVLCAGILILVITMPEQKTEPNLETDSKTEEEEYEADDSLRSIRQLEQKLESVLENLDGAGKVQVMIAEKSSSEKTVEKDVTSSEQTQQELGGEETGGTQQEVSREEKTVYGVDSRGNEVPFVIQEHAPEIQGVIIATQGGDDPVLAKKITEAVMALFGLEAHKIKVMKMK